MSELDDFHKARDVEALKHAQQWDLPHDKHEDRLAFKDGAKWAYQWCDNEFHIRQSVIDNAMDMRDKLQSELSKEKEINKLYYATLERARFELEMVSKHGGLNHRAIPKIDEALAKGDALRKGEG